LNLKRLKKILLWFFLSLLLLVLVLWIFIQTPFGQNWIAGQVTKRLSRDLQTKVSIQHVDFALFNRMHLEGVLIEDRDRDTLLYAGDVQVRITDWFFFKKEAELKFVGLKNATIKFQRTDSIWRQQFIVDYFTPTSTGAKKKAGIRFDLKQVELENVVFIKKDAWLGQDMIISVGGMNMNANDISLSGKNYDINNLTLVKPVIALHTYQGRKPGAPEYTPKTQQEFVDSILMRWNREQTVVKVANLKITDGVFKSDRENFRDPFAHFDGQNILFTEINADMDGVGFVGDTVYSHLTLSARERSGLIVKDLSANVKFTPVGMAFNDLNLETNRSTIRNSFTMSYSDMSDMADFLHKVQMTANFDGTYIDSDDLAFFAPALSTWNKKIRMKGKVKGTVDDLIGKDMFLQAGNSTVLNGDISLAGLPDINQTFIDFKANDFRTTYTDAVTIVPAMRKVTVPNLRAIEYVHFTGNFTGFIRDFVTFGTIRTNLGTVKTDLNMKLPRNQDAVYSGTVSTDNFQLGSFVSDPKIGAVALNGKVKGKGFSENSRDVTLDGTIRYFEYNKYRYNNITVKGRLEKKLFDGVATIADDNAKMTLNGIIDFNNVPPRFDLTADITQANLKNLNLSREDVAVRGKFKLDFTSSTIDNFLGNARVTDAEITHNGQRLPFDSLIIVSGYNEGVKTLTAESNEFKVKLSGNYTLSALPDAFTYMLNKYYPAYIPAPRRFVSNQQIDFDITTNYVEDYVKLIDSSLSGLNYSHLYGNIDLAKNELNLNGEIPQFKFKQYNFDDVKLNAKGYTDSLVLTGEAKNIRINDSLSIPIATFKINAHGDSSQVSLITGANQTLDKANLNALVLTYSDGVKVEFNPSDITINGKTWNIDQNGHLELRNKRPIAGQLVLREGDQEISLQTVASGTGSWNDLLVQLKNVNLGDLSPFLLPKNRLEGLASGSIRVEDPMYRFNASGELETKGLILDNDSLGNITSHIEYTNADGHLVVKGKNTDPLHTIDFNASLFLKNKTDAEKNHITLNAYRYPISILERFLKTLFSDMEGFMTGPVNLDGPLDRLSVTGRAKLENAGLRLNFTQCFYRIQDTYIELKPTLIDLNGITLIDTVTKNPIYLNGTIDHESFRNMFYDIIVSTRKPGTRDPNNNRPVQLIRTSYKDNQQFYGDVKGTGSFSLTGPQSEMFMQISAIASDRDSGYVTIPPSRSRQTSTAAFLVERKYGREIGDSGLIINNSNIIYDVDVTANNLLNVKVEIDPLTGDEIKGRGHGTLNIHSGTSEPLSIRGKYQIEEGNYLFTFQSLFKKPFVLRKGANNFIEWYGDPYDARINIEAVYTADNVGFAPLVKNWTINDDIRNAFSNVYVVAKLTNKLFSPDIALSLEFPPESVVFNDPTLSFRLQQMQKNPNEMNLQATYLVVLGTFAPPEGGGGNVSDIVLNSLTSSLSSIFFNVINEQVRKIVSNIFKTDKLNFSFNSSVYNRNVIDPTAGALNLGSNVNASVTGSLLKNRLIITVAGSVEGPVQSGIAQQKAGILPDLTVEILINEKGTFRANLFHRQNIDYLTTNTTGAGRMKKTGIGVSYRKDYDHFGELLRSIFQRKKPKQQPAQVSPVVGATQ
jgi:hypothetical protein